MAERTIHKPPTRDQLPETRQILGYNPLFDIRTYQDLNAKENLLSPQEFSRRKTQLDMRTKKNLETMLGERFNVEVSKVIYEIKNNQLISTLHDEPFLDVVRRGQRYRQKNGSNETERELAEVEGFEKVQKKLTDPQFEDAKIIVISPRGKKGSVYQHNFFDVYEKNGETITMTRYTSSAAFEQFGKIAQSLDPFCELPQNPLDSDFLQNPLITYKSIENILAHFPPHEAVITQEDLEKIVEICGQIILNYVNNPSQLTFNALLNFADHTLKMLKGSDPQLDYYAKPFTLRQTIAYFGSQQVRQVTAGCGLQGGFSSPFTINNNLPFTSSFPYSVAEYANCPECGASANHFHCPKDKGGCGEPIQTGVGIITCPSCGLTKKKAGSSC